MEIQTPYLDAIQLIPGETIGEKYKWIAKLIKDRISECNSLEEIVEDQKVPRLLAPLIQVHAAQLLNKRDPKNQDNYKAIAEALKSDNVEVVTKALQVKSFFDGSNKMFTNVDYFLNELFPLVSLNTRTRIIKNLSIRLKETALAEEFFTAIAATYGLDQALPLLPACSEGFMFDTVVNKRIVLSRKLVKTIFRKYPDFVVRYLRLSKPSNDRSDRNLHKVDINCMGDFLAALIKKRLSSFVELFEMHEDVPLTLKLSRKRAVCFLKNGKDHLLKKPKLFINLVPLQMISVSRMEVMFPKLFPEKLANFGTDTMLDYLAHYPEEKKADLLIKSYRDVYGKNILDESSSVTASLMWLLPVEERIRQARIKIERESDTMKYGIEDYRHIWRCYLPTKETIPKIKEEIAKSPELETRAALVSQMICNCRVNCDDQALLEVLTYVRDRHKNESSLFLLKVLEDLMELYNLPRLNKDVWAVLMDIILRAHVKNELTASSYTSIKIVEAAIHFRIINEQPIDKEIDILVDLKCQKSENWNILKKYPEHERRCLEACIAIVSQRFSSDPNACEEDRDGILHDLTRSIYAFNATHSKNTRVEPMSIKNYPWLLKEIERIIQTNAEANYYIIESLKSILRKNERDLAERLFGKEALEDRELFSLLKRNPKVVLSMWKECLNAFQNNFGKRSARTFMRTARWYNEIPVKFLQQSLADLRSKKDGVCLQTIALLVHGETLVKILEPLMPTDQMLDIHHEQAKDNYRLTLHTISCTKSSNPPIPFSLLCRYCEGDYLPLALIAMVNLCRRSLLSYVLSFARTLATQRVSVRKHGVRMMHLVASRDQLHRFLLSEWKTEEHYSIRDVLFSTARKLFSEEPGPTTWSLISQMISALNENNASAISDAIRMIPSVSDMYVADFVKLVLGAVDKLPESEGWVRTSLISAISPSVCNLLPEELNEQILRRFLLVQSMTCASVASSFAQNSYLMAAGDKFEARMNTFTEVFVEAVRTRWNMPHPKKPHFRTANYGLRLFTDLLVFNLTGSGQLRVLDGILNAFLKALTPQMDPTTYLLLVFRREQVAANTPKDFGLNLGRKLQELMRIFSPLFIGFMTNILNNLLSKREFAQHDRDYSRLSVIEGLVEIGTVEATLIAVGLMTPVVEKQYVHRYDDLMSKFLEHNHPAVKSIACDNVNKANNSNFYFENE
ncbi:uncharacterized protein LOC143214234 [Lasioglossum baleicum]|uniref:uncharacterized protein LOC143214234 n=1 Tax=Lasioglossum baleicum TaxID=434251 RepID=UPI003FCE8CB8